MNNILYHWKKTDTLKCDYCECDRQTPVYMFVQCKVTKQIWDKLKIFITQCTKIKGSELLLTTENIMLNTVHSDPRNIVNLFTLVVKQHIYYCKCFGKRITFRGIVNKFERL